jgi:hypothetical protein
MIELQESTWGIRLNEKHYSKFDIEAPDWAKNDLGHSWYSEGIVIWDEAEKTVISSDFWYAMTLLEHLRSNTKWKERGQDVSEEKYQFSIPIRRPRRSKSAPPEEEPPIENKKIITKLHLSSERTQKLLDFLEQNERLITSEGTFIKDRYDQAMKMIADWIIEDIIKERNQNNTPEQDNSHLVDPNSP